MNDNDAFRRSRTYYRAGLILFAGILLLAYLFSLQDRRASHFPPRHVPHIPPQAMLEILVGQSIPEVDRAFHTQPVHTQTLPNGGQYRIYKSPEMAPVRVTFDPQGKAVQAVHVEYSERHR